MCLTCLICTRKRSVRRVGPSCILLFGLLLAEFVTSLRDGPRSSEAANGRKRRYSERYKLFAARRFRSSMIFAMAPPVFGFILQV